MLREASPKSLPKTLTSPYSWRNSQSWRVFSKIEGVPEALFSSRKRSPAPESRAPGPQPIGDGPVPKSFTFYLRARARSPPARAHKSSVRGSRYSAFSRKRSPHGAITRPGYPENSHQISSRMAKADSRRYRNAIPKNLTIEPQTHKQAHKC